MNILKPRRERCHLPPPLSHSTFNCLTILILFTFIGPDQSAANLYSDFNSRLDLISNLAKNRLKKDSTSATDEIYERTENLLKRQMLARATGNDADSGNKPKMKEIAKLIDVLSPNYYLDESQNYPVDKGHILTEDTKSHRCNNDDDRNSWDSRVQDEARMKYLYLKDENFALEGVNCNFASDGRNWENQETDERKNPEMKGIKLLLKNLSKRYSPTGSVVDPKPIMNSAPSLYPSVIAKPVDFVAPRLDISNSNPLSVGLNIRDFTAMSNAGSPGTSSFSVQSLNQLKELEDYLQHNTAHTGQVGQQRSRSTESLNFEQTSTSNASNILDRVLNELEAIRELNTGNLTEDGSPCEVGGFWNAEMAGVRFDISMAKNVSNPVSLKIEIHKKRTPAKEALMDIAWNCTGITMNTTGGPFHMTAVKESGNISGTFSGYCMKCGGCDTVFGSWTFIYPCKNCAEISMAIETKRDIFRRDIEEERKAREKKGKLGPKRKRMYSNYDEKTECNYEDVFENLRLI